MDARVGDLRAAHDIDAAQQIAQAEVERETRDARERRRSRDFLSGDDEVVDDEREAEEVVVDGTRLEIDLAGGEPFRDASEHVALRGRRLQAQQQESGDGGEHADREQGDTQEAPQRVTARPGGGASTGGITGPTTMPR